MELQCYINLAVKQWIKQKHTMLDHEYVTTHEDMGHSIFLKFLTCSFHVKMDIQTDIFSC